MTDSEETRPTDGDTETMAAVNHEPPIEAPIRVFERGQEGRHDSV